MAALKRKNYGGCAGGGDSDSGGCCDGGCCEGGGCCGKTIDSISLDLLLPATGTSSLPQSRRDLMHAIIVHRQGQGQGSRLMGKGMMTTAAAAAAGGMSVPSSHHQLEGLEKRQRQMVQQHGAGAGQSCAQSMNVDITDPHAAKTSSFVN
jgi:hypothetical protein